MDLAALLKKKAKKSQKKVTKTYDYNESYDEQYGLDIVAASVLSPGLAINTSSHSQTNEIVSWENTEQGESAAADTTSTQIAQSKEDVVICSPAVEEAAVSTKEASVVPVREAAVTATAVNMNAVVDVVSTIVKKTSTWEKAKELKVKTADNDAEAVVEPEVEVKAQKFVARGRGNATGSITGPNAPYVAIDTASLPTLDEACAANKRQQKKNSSLGGMSSPTSPASPWSPGSPASPVAEEPGSNSTRPKETFKSAASTPGAYKPPTTSTAGAYKPPLKAAATVDDAKPAEESKPLTSAYRPPTTSTAGAYKPPLKAAATVDDAKPAEESKPLTSAYRPPTTSTAGAYKPPTTSTPGAYKPPDKR